MRHAECATEEGDTLDELTIRALLAQMVSDAGLEQAGRDVSIGAVPICRQVAEEAATNPHTSSDEFYMNLDESMPYHLLLECAYSQILAGNLGLALLNCELAARRLDLAGRSDYQVDALRGYVLYRIGDLYGALEDLSHAIGLCGEQAALYFWRGVVSLSLSNLDAACADLATFILRHPTGAAIALAELARAFGAAGEPALPVHAL